MKPKRHLITAALPYANGPIHIGHLSGAYLPADIYTRFLRALGEEVIYICGSDEHGVPIMLKAKKEGVSTRQVIDRYHSLMKDTFERFGIQFDYYGRTSSPKHYEVASEFFKKLYEKGVLQAQETDQLYDPEAQLFLADRFVTGVCPKCSVEGAYGDQCEKCGTSHSPTELLEPKSSITGAAPILKHTKHWFLPLDRYAESLVSWVESEGKKNWRSTVYRQVKGWLDDGLKPRAVTRDLDWGVPVPIEGEEAQGKVLYVWFDAPIGYISATQEWAASTGADWTLFWKNKETELVHFIGKDNIVFHTLIFPTMLKAHGEYILPKYVPANEFLNLEGQKLSTSRNWAVWLHEYLDDFPGKQDALRYVLTANAPETKDTDFTWALLQSANNHELVAILGNFIHRTMTLIHKYYEGKVPEPDTLTDTDQSLLKVLGETANDTTEALRHFKFREALVSFMTLSRLGNKYLAEEEPWKIFRENPKRVQTVLYVSIQVSAYILVLSDPFLPHMSQKLKVMIGEVGEKAWLQAQKGHLFLESGRQLGTPQLLFEKIEDEAIAKQREKLKEKSQE